MKNSNRYNSRRFFLQGCGTMGALSMASAMTNLNLINAASAACAPDGGSDYKALVCVFLFGGNDSLNMVIPSDTGPYNLYNSSRTNLSIARNTVLQHAINPATYSDPNNGSNFGLHPSLDQEFDGNNTVSGSGATSAGIRELFEDGDLAFMTNVGTLVEPILDNNDFRNKERPPQLLSHNSQQFQWQTGRPDGNEKTGWGGRIADLVYCLNGSSAFTTNVSLDGFNTFQVGNTVAQYGLSQSGRPDGLEAPNYLNDLARDVLGGTRNWLGQGYGEIKGRALDNFEALAQILETAPEPPGNERFPNSGLGRQLESVARLIGVRNQLPTPARRQIFFCTRGGFDTHGNQNNQQPNLLRDVSQSMTAFQKSLRTMGLAADVTTFTVSDFGRTLTSNGSGSDHAWGGTQMIMGGGVNGGEIYGELPRLALDSELNINSRRGHFIPTTAVDQYAAILANWFGVPVSELSTILPNYGRFEVPFGNSRYDFML